MNDSESSQAIAWLVAPEYERRQRAAYYTPRSIAQFIATWSVRDPSDTVLEPSFGGCELLECLSARYGELTSSNSWDKIFGCDVSSHAFKALRSRLLREPASSNFLQCDFLKLRAGKELPFVSTVVANPPYVRHDRLTSRQRRTVERVIRGAPVRLPNRSNLWAYFTLHALSFVRRGGRIAFVLPPSFLSADFSIPLRKHLATLFKRHIAIEVGERLFSKDGTEEGTVLLLADGYQEGRSNLEVWRCESATVLNCSQLAPKPIARAVDIELSTSMGIGALVDSVSARLNSTSLAEVATTRIGIVTGNTDFFIATFPQWKERGIARCHLVPILASAKAFKALTTGRRVTDVDGGSFVLNVRSRRPPAQVSKYLATLTAEEVRDNVTFSKRDPWFVLDDGAVPDAFIASVFHFGPRLTLNELGMNATNSLYRLYFHDKSQSRHRLLAISMLTTYSQLASELIGRPMSQGGLKLSVGDLNALPVALPESISPTRITETFHHINKKLEAGEHDKARSAADELILQPLHPDDRAKLVCAYLAVRGRRLGA